MRLSKTLFFWMILFRFKPANRKSVFLELTYFKSLFLVNFQVSTLNESLHFLVKLSCESFRENLDAILVSARSAICFFQPILQLSKKSSWPSLWLHFLYLHDSDVHQHTFNWSRVGTLLQDTDSRSRSLVPPEDMDLVQFLSDWLTYAIDNARGPQRVWKNLDFMSLNAMKCDCGSIFVCYFHQVFFHKRLVIYLPSFSE